MIGRTGSAGVWAGVLTLFVWFAIPSLAWAAHSQPPLDPSKVDYTPIGFYGPADEAGTPRGESDTVPSSGPVPQVGPNPSGKWVSYDTNVWESLALPSRHPGDNCNSLPAEKQHPDCREGDRDADDDGPQGTGWPFHGLCPPSLDFVAGECQNHQLEYLDYFERSMKEMLADFGVVTHRYGFQSPGTGGRGNYLDASGGQAYNVAAVVPGTDHPEETVLVSGHYDFTDSGPAAAWDSAEGHTQVMRMAKIMSDYWRATNTRPSATVKFIPWDSEESGTHGSADYVENNIPPGEEAKVRGYFNVDPCAGAYPAFRNGNPASRVPQVMQLADPEAFEEGSAVRARIDAFNARAEGVVDEVFDRLDDTITVAPGVERKIFVSDDEAAQEGVASQRGEIVTAVGGLAAFSSDYANFEAVGIPIFNLFPDYFGPHADGTPASGEGVGILHSPRDNLTTINALTSSDQTGLTASEGWAKGQEMCAQLEAWYMLQPGMSGAQTAGTEPVAYYEALPNEAIKNQAVTFDAGGSHQYTDAQRRTLVDDSQLSYEWDFGDGRKASGKVVQHAYSAIGRYETKLTVRSQRSGRRDTMTLPVVVVSSNFRAPSLAPIDEADAKDGSFSLSWTFDGDRDGFQQFSVEESTNLATLFTDPADDGPDGPDGNWKVEEPSDPKVQPWQASDSNTPKVRENQSRSAPRSFWTGVSPSDLAPSPTNVRSMMTMKQPISVPKQGDPELNFWSVFQSEGDDQGRVEVALDDGDPATAPEWQAVDVTQAVNTALGQTDRNICNPSDPSTFETDFEYRRASLAPYRGKRLLVRFVYLLGPNDRALSQPCGWYVDDVRVQTGEFELLSTTTDTSFTVANRRNGTYAYRVKGVYSDAVTTAPSNIETATVSDGCTGRCR